MLIFGSQVYGAFERALPAGYVKIVAGVTRGFDHVKFEQLCSKYLTDVSSEIEAEKAKINWVEQFDPSNFCNYIEELILGHKQVQDAASAAQVIEAVKRGYSYEQGWQNLRPLINDCLLRCGVNPASVTVVVSQKEYLMSNYISSYDPKKAVLTIGNGIVEKFDYKLVLNKDAYLGKEGHRFLIRQYFESLVMHEAAHIKYGDCMLRIQCDASGVSVEQVARLTALQAKRADLFAVFNSPNPIAFVNFLNGSGASGQLHRNEQIWADLKKDILSCYASEFKKTDFPLIEQVLR